MSPVIVLRKKGQPAFEIIEGVHVYRIQRRVHDETGPFSYLRKLLVFFLRSAWCVSGRHWRTPYDLIHVHSVPDFEVFATLIPRIMGARVILDIHDIVPEFYVSKFKMDARSLAFRLLVLVEKLSTAYSSHVIISNHLWYSRLLQRSVAARKCTPIINYPDTGMFYRRQSANREGKAFVLCYPGTLNWHQGLDLAIEAVARLRDKLPSVKLLIIGDGPERERLKIMVVRLGLDDHVSITGFIPIEKVAATMADVDLGVVPKRNDSFGDEAFSTKIPEFMAMGVPVVAAKTRIDQFYFTEGMVQFFKPGDVADLADKIWELVQNPARYHLLREGGRRFVEENNWEVKKGEYLALVDGLCGTTSLKRDRLVRETRSAMQ